MPIKRSIDGISEFMSLFLLISCFMWIEEGKTIKFFLSTFEDLKTDSICGKLSRKLFVFIFMYRPSIDFINSKLLHFEWTIFHLLFCIRNFERRWSMGNPRNVLLISTLGKLKFLSTQQHTAACHNLVQFRLIVQHFSLNGEEFYELF